MNHPRAHVYVLSASASCAPWFDGLTRRAQLDVVVANNNAPGVEFHRNLDNGRSFEAMDASSVMDFSAVVTGLRAGDIDGDGDVDLIFALDSLTVYNGIYTNLRGGAYSKLLGMAVTSASESTMSVSLADYDNDGDLDIFVGNGCCGVYSGNAPAGGADELHR